MAHFVRSDGGSLGPRKKLHVLAVDDDESVLRTLRLSLRHRAVVSTATGAKDAIRKIVEGKLIDAILCDVRMPEGSGELLHRWLQLTRPQLLARMGFVTGLADEFRYQVFLRGHPVLRKPFTPGGLNEFVEGLVRRGRRRR